MQILFGFEQKGLNMNITYKKHSFLEVQMQSCAMA